MTTTDNRSDWEQKLQRFQAMHILFEADEQWGPLNAANISAASSASLAAMTGAEERDAWLAEHGRARDREERELARHMVEIYDPLIEAGLSLVRTPAPDLGAVRTKHEACNADGFRLIDHEDEEGELFGIIRADVARLLGDHL